MVLTLAMLLRRRTNFEGGTMTISEMETELYMALRHLNRLHDWIKRGGPDKRVPPDAMTAGREALAIVGGVVRELEGRQLGQQTEDDAQAEEKPPTTTPAPTPAAPKPPHRKPK
jgi:hypothetical protein